MCFSQGLTGLIISCLQQVASTGGTTVTFPTLGCGKFETPPPALAECFLEAVQQFPNIQVFLNNICLLLQNTPD